MECTHVVRLDLYRVMPTNALCLILVGAYQGLLGGLASEVIAVLAVRGNSFGMTPIIIDSALSFFSATSPRFLVATNWLVLASCVIFFSIVRWNPTLDLTIL